MRAVGVRHYGGPEALELVELPTPEPGPGEVRVRVQAAAINPADVMVRDGSLADWYAEVEPPFIPGMDVAGVIDALGPNLDPALGLDLGQRVVGIVDNHGQHGGYSEFVVLPADSVTAAPAGASTAEAATFLMPALTARAALDALNLPSEATVLVTGAAGGVGRFAVALAHAQGLRVFALASEADEAFVRSLGADEFVGSGEDPADRILALLPGGVDAVIDGAALRETITPAIRDGGQLATLRAWNGEAGRGITHHQIHVRKRTRDRPAITRLREQVEAGKLPLQIAAAYPASEAVQAHHAFDAGHVRGRIVLLFDAFGEEHH